MTPVGKSSRTVPAYTPSYRTTRSRGISNSLPTFQTRETSLSSQFDQISEAAADAQRQVYDVQTYPQYADPRRQVSTLKVKYEEKTPLKSKAQSLQNHRRISPTHHEPCHGFTHKMWHRCMGSVHSMTPSTNITWRRSYPQEIKTLKC